MICNTTAFWNMINHTTTQKNVEIFNQIMPLKQHFKTFILEKITMHKGSKQAIVKQEKLNFKAITRRLRSNI